MAQADTEVPDVSADPRVSVIIPTYNRFNGVVRCLENVRNQTYKNLEILIVDDCSTESYDWRRLVGARILKTPRNHGGAALARNIGLAACKGDYICFIDHDDAWHPEKVRRQIDDLRRNNFHFSATEGRMVVNPAQLDANPIYHKEYYKNFMLHNRGSTTLPRIFDLKFLQQHNYIINSSVMISREVYEKIGPLSESVEHLRTEDREYWLRILAANYNCLYLDEPLVYFRAF
jgi:glycosyltransferase involved in cell wall biosynthesis